MSAENDFSVGSIPRHIIDLAIPMTLGQFVQMAYNLVDRIYIGHLPGTSSMALTGLGLTFPIITIIMAFTNLFGTGGMALYSIARGKHDIDAERRYMENTFIMLCLTSIFVMLLGYLFMKPILYLFGASDVTYPYSTEYLRGICDIWDLRGSGLTNMHGSTGDIVLLGTTTPQLEEVFHELTHKMHNDLGGSGSNLRTPAACLGQSRCEFACYNTQDACYQLTEDYQDELYRPAFPYKFKFKFDGCPNGCVCAMARSDFAVVGTWRDDIKIDQEKVRAYVGGEIAPNAGAHAGRDWGAFDIQAEVVDRCPGHCMKWDGQNLHIKTADCVRCMHCIDTMPEALHIGDDRGASILCGAKAPVVDGAQMASLLVPFVRVENPYDELKDIIEKIWDWWIEEGKNRERLGELMKRQSFQKLLEVTGVEAQPYHVTSPRANPYIFFKEEEVPGGFTRDLKDYRSRHQR